MLPPTVRRAAVLLIGLLFTALFLYDFYGVLRGLEPSPTAAASVGRYECGLPVAVVTAPRAGARPKPGTSPLDWITAAFPAESSSIEYSGANWADSVDWKALAATLGPGPGGQQTKLLLLIRHGEGEHNVAKRRFSLVEWFGHEAYDPRYLDADLTAIGRGQAVQLGLELATAAAAGLRIDRLVVSPLSRAIATAMLAFGPGELGRVRPICIESTREKIGRYQCDKRRSTDELKERFGLRRAEPGQPIDNNGFSGGYVDFSRLSATDELWDLEHRETDSEVTERAERSLAEIAALVGPEAR